MHIVTLAKKKKKKKLFRNVEVNPWSRSVNCTYQIFEVVSIAVDASASSVEINIELLVVHTTLFCLQYQIHCNHWYAVAYCIHYYPHAPKNIVFNSLVNLDVVRFYYHTLHLIRGEFS